MESTAMPASVKKFLFSFSIFIFSFFSLNSNAGYIADEISHMVRSVNPIAKIGVVVQSMNTGRTYYSRDANQYFAPASVQKLFTVSSALIDLGPNFHFATRVFTTGQTEQGVVHGDLIFQFNGDPSLTSQDMIGLVDQLRTLGIRRIDGNILVDNTAFNHIPYPAGWLWDDLISDFAAPLDTVIINCNKFGLSFVPARRAGERPELIPQLPPGSATFINEMRTTNYSTYNCPVSIVSNEANQYLVRGCLARRSGVQHRTLAIRNMEIYTQSLLRQLLYQHDIQFNGRIFSAKTPQNAHLLTEHLSAPLSHIIVHLLKESDNLYADALFKKMGEYHDHRPGSWQNGLTAVLTILSRDVGIDLNNLHLVDGSGLSQYNRVTPNDVSQMLHFIDDHSMLRNSLIPALPIAGVDGTLAYRMPNLARGRLVHAKTGSMTGVSTLAGFVKTRTHGVLSFVIMINKVPKDRWPYVLLENHIVELLARS
ncbi:MAG TPA: D-alanyl-D-alanine carboxypeptidase/D-alanyl-D-alanine-endopeptidase [Coxiellaceae bacterium]|nr:MAG: D-alanyl-D-alanine carboxypeptidase/D-alanyl-D-alanine-endopeptidase [Gammaproteobacteria bacterium RIFCSPHIGHO2_12_FULL_36_30]HLB55956.1 D-alanyl-D-alanine carboxypeptidase/D-alanyl-D-alanine-endopeptidase [Coxiellaceae bacterium]